MPAHTVADQLVEQLVDAGVRRIYGIVGDSLNPVVDAVRRTGGVPRRVASTGYTCGTRKRQRSRPRPMRNSPENSRCARVRAGRAICT